MKFKLQPPTNSGSGVLLGGVEVPMVTGVEIVDNPGEVPQVTLKVLVTEALDVELDGEVTIEFHPIEGCELVTEPMADGRVRFRGEQKASA